MSMARTQPRLPPSDSQSSYDSSSMRGGGFAGQSESLSIHAPSAATFDDEEGDDDAVDEDVQPLTTQQLRSSHGQAAHAQHAQPDDHDY